MHYIRNFSIIAHIDHGKSTLADRMLEYTDTVAQRQMREQVLDGMDLERERGITIKMAPARMRYTYEGTAYDLNLIDTPGHIDFSYEVSRALKAVEGALLLVDATQGIQAQTLSTLTTARELGVTIIPVVTKTDAPHARTDEVVGELVEVLGCDAESVVRVSGKTGDGVPELLQTIIDTVPPPEPRLTDGRSQALVFDFDYSEHRGVIVFVRVFSGRLNARTTYQFCAASASFTPMEVGTVSPQPVACDELTDGMVGYVVTGIKKPGVASVGDTVTGANAPAPALEGYREPQPVVWASMYPENQDAFVALRQALERLKLTDSSLTFEEESSSVLGRGFRCGFLGMLHLEIVTERLRREYDLAIIATSPTITYEVTYADGTCRYIRTPSQFPDHATKVAVREPWVSLEVMTPSAYLGAVMQLLYEREAHIEKTETFGGGRVRLLGRIPLRELMRGTFDALKSVTSGFASLSYEIDAMAPADVVRMDVLVAEEEVPAFSRIVARRRAQEEAEEAVERLEATMPRQLFVVKLQARVEGRIIASRKLSALKKNVTGHLYGGDVTRKRKLWEKQKKGKKKMQAQGTVEIPHDVYIKMMRNEN